MNKPNNKKECFVQLDEMLSESDKRAIVEAEALFEFHFTIGLWIRNNWLYNRSAEDEDSFCREFSIPFFEPDVLSSEILEAYQKYLKKTYKQLVQDGTQFN